MTRARIFEVACWFGSAVLIYLFVVYGLNLDNPGLVWWFALGAAIGLIKAS